MRYLRCLFLVLSLLIFTGSFSSAATVIGRYPSDGTTYSVFVAGDYAYLADGFSGLKILDISNPAHPVLLGKLNLYGEARDVFVVGDYAYLAVGYSGFKIVDVSDPRHPRLVDTFDTSGEAQGIYVAGDYAYLADGYKGLSVFNVRTPSNIMQVGRLDTDGEARALFVAGQIAYLADGSKGLKVIRVSVPSLPVTIGEVDTSGQAYDVFVAGDYAYVADGYKGLKVVNVFNPVDPDPVGALDTDGQARGVYVAGDYAYLADGRAGFKLIDISDPAHPRLIRRLETDGEAFSLQLVGTLVYLADGQNGLLIIDVSEDVEQPVCDSDHLDLCTTKVDCEAAGGHWCAGYCQRERCAATLAGPWALVVNTLDCNIKTINLSSFQVYGPFLLGDFGACDISNPQDYSSMSPLIDIATVPDADFALISNAGGKTVFKVDLSNPTYPELEDSLKLEFPIMDLTITPDGKYALAAGGRQVALIQVNPLALVDVHTVSSAGTFITCVATDGRWVVLCDMISDRLIYGYFDPNYVMASERLLSTGKDPLEAAFSPDRGTLLVACFDDQSISAYRVSDTGIVSGSKIQGLPGPPISLAFNSLGNRAYVVSLAEGNWQPKLSWLSVTAPGRVSMGVADGTDILSPINCAFVGMDVIAILPDERHALIGNPGCRGSTDLALVDLSTFAVSNIPTNSLYPAEVALFKAGGMFVDIKVNGEDNPETLNEYSLLSITLTLDPMGQTGRGDYFLWAKIPGGACYCYAYPRDWRPCPCDAPRPSYQGQLLTFRDFPLPTISCNILPVGHYELYFAVDATMDNRLDEKATRDKVEFEIR